MILVIVQTAFACPQGLSSWNKLCLQECPSGLYRNQTHCTAVCQAYSYHRQCKKHCLPGQYFDSGCKACQGHCATCWADSQSCRSCHQPYVLYRQSCVEQCPEGLSASNRICLRFRGERKLAGSTTTPKYTIIEVGPGQYEAIFDIDPAQYPNLEFNVGLANPSAITDENGNIPVVSSQVVQLSNPSNFKSADLNQYVVGLCVFLMGLYVLVAFCTFWQGAIVWAYSVSVMQLLALSYYINVVFSPTLGNSLLKVQWAYLNFLPNPLSASIGNATYVSTLPYKVYQSLGDNSYSRTAGFLLSVILVIAPLAIICRLLHLSEICPSSLATYSRKLFQAVFQHRVLTQSLMLFNMPIVFFFGLQILDFKVTNFALGFGVALGAVLILLLVGWIIYLSYKEWKFSKVQFQLQYLLQNVEDKILSNVNEVDFYKFNLFKYRDKVLDLRNPRSPKLGKKFIFGWQSEDSYRFAARMHMPILQARLLLCSLTMVAAMNNPIVQCGGVLLINIAYLIYFILVWPSRVKIMGVKLHNLFGLFSEVCLLAYWGAQLVFVLNQTWTSDKLVSFCNIITALLDWNLFIQLFYLIGRSCHELHSRFWIWLIKTEWFKYEFKLVYDELNQQKQPVQRVAREQLKDIEKLLERKKKKRRNVLRPKEGLQLLDQEYLPKHLLKEVPISEVILSRRSQNTSSVASLSKGDRKRVMGKIFKASPAQRKQESEQNFEMVKGEEEDFVAAIRSRRRNDEEAVEEKEIEEKEAEDSDMTFEYWEEEFEEEEFERIKPTIYAEAKGDFVLP